MLEKFFTPFLQINMGASFCPQDILKSISHEPIRRQLSDFFKKIIIAGRPPDIVCDCCKQKYKFLSKNKKLKNSRIPFTFDHKHGKEYLPNKGFRGWICRQCNWAEGLLRVVGEGNPTIGAQRILEYLSKSEAQLAKYESSFNA